MVLVVRAFYNVLNDQNMDVEVISSAKQIRDAKRIILPGVGAFDYVMDKIRMSGIEDELDSSVNIWGKPILGVCVGMQVLLQNSGEG